MFAKEVLLFPTTERSNYRIPSIVATKDGTVLAFCNDRKNTVADEAAEVSLVCSSKKAGEDWSPIKPLVEISGWACNIGSAVYDELIDTVMCSFNRSPLTRSEWGDYTKEQLAEMDRQAAERAKELGIERGDFLLKSSDGGKTWSESKHVVNTYTFTTEEGKTHTIGGGCHGSAHGIQLRHGVHKGRLLCPSRVVVGKYKWFDELSRVCYNNAIYSDDHGKTWYASAPVQLGTGEGTLIETSDGTIIYNSRAYFRDQKRYLANSTDGGETYGDFRTDDFLIEEKAIGCNASFLCVEQADLKDISILPEGADSVTVFVNPRAETRRNMTACVSFDSGTTWVHTKTICESESAYSSLVFSPIDQHFYLMYEKGGAKNPYEQGIALLEFDLEWLLAK